MNSKFAKKCSFRMTKLFTNLGQIQPNCFGWIKMSKNFFKKLKQFSSSFLQWTVLTFHFKINHLFWKYQFKLTRTKFLQLFASVRKKKPFWFKMNLFPPTVALAHWIEKSMICSALLWMTLYTEAKGGGEWGGKEAGTRNTYSKSTWAKGEQRLF